MKLHCHSVTRIMIALLLAGALLILSGCILDVIQPETADAGQPFQALVKIDPEVTGTYPIYMGVRMPSDWQMVGAPVYTDGLTGTLTYSPTAVALLEEEYGIVTGTTWWAGAGPSIPVTKGVTVTIQAEIESSIHASGVYTLVYADGVHTGSTIIWHDSDYLSWRPITITAYSGTFQYLPVIIR
ncbi:MAG: hypothetical protein JXA21_05580 [Anaerolineae bacterium]|nr:hypothetical protein [Anaerolineae bacterium]